jgi:hypothetical protein
MAAGPPAGLTPVHVAPHRGTDGHHDRLIDLITASQLHILRWQAWLGGLSRRLGAPPPGPGLAGTWDTVAALIDLHMAADEEVCAPAIYDRTPPGRALAQEGKQAHAEISEMISETHLHPPGTTPWWHLATMTLAAWSRQCDDENRGLPAQCRRRADPALRQQLGRQWRAFSEAWIRDRYYPDTPSQLPTCQLRFARPARPAWPIRRSARWPAPARPATPSPPVSGPRASARAR